MCKLTMTPLFQLTENLQEVQRQRQHVASEGQDDDDGGGGGDGAGAGEGDPQHIRTPPAR